MKEEILRIVTRSIERASGRGELEIPSTLDIEVNTPKRAEFGDFSTNAALVLGGMLGRNPREVARIVISNISDDDRRIFKKIDVAGVGFINFFIKEGTFLQRITEIERLGESYGRNDLGKGDKVLVEFVSANPTGYLHLGHARGAAVGDAIANILEASGFDVTREFYINDTGRQIELLGLSTYRRYQELFGVHKDMPEDGYHGDYIKDIALGIKEDLGEKLLNFDEEEASRLSGEYAKEELMEEIKRDLRDFGVRFDSWYSESLELHTPKEELGGKDRVQAVLDVLRSRNLIEEKEGALWFRGTLFDDSQDWVLVRGDGTPTYFASDIAYHRDKVERGFKKLINLWGADHHGHISRLTAALGALGYESTSFGVVLIQFVRLVSGGEEISMSKRAGSYVTLRELMEEVGRDAMKFFLVMRSSESHLDFDLKLAKESSSENPVYYVQYAHARIESVFEKAREREIRGSAC